MTSKNLILIAPPNSPNQPLSEQIVVLSDGHMFLDLVKAIVLMQVASPERRKHLILKLNEAKLPELSKSHQPAAGEVKGDEQYKFVVRHELEMRNGTIIHVDINSECLRDLLQTVLADVCGIDIDEWKLSVGQSAFRQLLAEYEVCHNLLDLCPARNECLEEEYIDIDRLDRFPYPRPEDGE